MNYKKGDIVKIADNFRESYEDPNERYMVLEDRENAVLMKYIDVDHKFALGALYCWPKETVELDIALTKAVANAIKQI